MPLHFRTMKDSEAEAVSRLIQRTFQRFIAADYTSRGRRCFLKNTSKRAILRRKRKNQLLIVAEDNHTISGLVVVRKGNHISLFFVAPEFHRREIGTRLFREALDRMKAAMPDLGNITVNSSEFALPFYTKLGFVAKRSAYYRRGMKITPMELQL